MLLISEKPIEQKLYLKGKEGYGNGINILNRLCREITGIDEARSLNQEDIVKSEYWDNEKKNNLIFGDDKKYSYWLGSSYVYTDSGFADFGMRDVFGGSVDGGCLCNSGGDCYYGSGGVRPVVSLEINILNK